MLTIDDTTVPPSLMASAAMCECASMMPGDTNLPVPSMTSAPAGTVTLAPSAAIFPSRNTMVPFWMVPFVTVTSVALRMATTPGVRACPVTRAVAAGATMAIRNAAARAAGLRSREITVGASTLLNGSVYRDRRGNVLRYGIGSKSLHRAGSKCYRPRSILECDSSWEIGMKHRFVFAATAATLILSACGSNEARDAAPAPPATPAFASDRISVTPRGAGPDIILIHGLGAHRDVWNASADQLDDRYRL